MPAVSGNTFEIAPFSLLTYGIRFFGRRISAGLAFIKGLGDLAAKEFPLGIPLVTYNARF